MIFCSQCGAAMEDNAKFCQKCGNPVAPAAPEAPVYTQPQYAQPQYAQPQYTQPQYTQPQAPVYPQSAYPQPVSAYQPEEPAVPGKVKANGFVGMGLAIGGLIFAVIGILYTLIFMEMPPAGFVFALVMGIFSMPLSFVGRSLCNKSIDQGNTSNSCSVGLKIGIAAIIVSGIMLFFGVINLAV